MLQRLLEEIGKGGVINVQEAAALLDTTPEMVVVMLEHLERTGVIIGSTDCDLSACSSCPLGGGICHTGTGKKARFWRIKGGESEYS